MTPVDWIPQTSVVTVYEAWAAVMADVLAVSKNERNQAQNFNFRGIDAVVNAVGPALREHKVIVVPELVSARYRDVEVGRNRTAMREVTVEVRYTVFGPAGDSFSGIVPGESMDSGDKGTAKAMSVAYRTFLLQALTIPTDEPDPDSESFERAPNVIGSDDVEHLQNRLRGLPDYVQDSVKALVKQNGPLRLLSPDQLDEAHAFVTAIEDEISEPIEDQS